MADLPNASVLFADADHEAMGAGAHLIHFVIVGVAFVAFLGYVWSESHPDESSSRRDWPSGQRWLVSTLLVIAGVGHLPVTQEHLAEAPYMGVLFIVFVVAALALAGLLLISPSRRAYVTAAALCAGAVLTYVVSRIVAVPQLAGDVGHWLEPIGMLCVASEIGAVIVILRQLLSPQHMTSENQAAAGRTDPRHAPGGGGIPGAYV